MREEMELPIVKDAKIYVPALMCIRLCASDKTQQCVTLKKGGQFHRMIPYNDTFLLESEAQKYPENTVHLEGPAYLWFKQIISLL